MARDCALRPGQAALLALLAFSLSCAVGLKPEVVARLTFCGEAKSMAQCARAEGLLAVGRPDEALMSFKELHAKFPGSAHLAVQMRKSISLMGRKKQANELAAMRAQFETLHAKELGKGKPLLEANLAFCIALCTEDLHKRSAWLDKAIAKDPDHYYARTLAGDVLWRSGLIERSRSQLKKALRIHNGIAEAWLRLAVISEELGFNNKADGYYATYLRMRPKDLQIKNNYARFLVKYIRNAKGRKKARAVIQELLASDPENLEYQLHEAANYWSEGHLLAAESVYQALLARYPKDARITLNLGNLYFERLAAPSKALQVYRYLLTQPISNDPITMLNQSLPIRIRVKELEKQLAGKLPKSPASQQELR